MDVDTERLMQDVIREEFKGATVICVAHRLDAIMDFDRVLVLDKGQIIEDGNPKILLQHESAFRTLYNSFK